MNAFALLAAGSPKVPSDLAVAGLVAIVLVVASIPFGQRMAKYERNAALFRIVMASAILHLLCAPAQIFVVDHVYHGVADYLRYDHQGSILANHWRAGQFTFAGSGVNRILGDGSVSIAAAVVMTIVGANQLAAFFVFAWFAFVGLYCFQRAFAITFPEANGRRYTLLVLFFPSILFWTADVSKEAIMTLSLGLTAYGIARVLRRIRGGYPLVVVGGLLGLWVRPNELVLLLVGFAIGMVLRQPDHSPSRGARRAGSIVFVVGAVVAAGFLTSKFLHAAGGSGLSLNTLNHLSTGNRGSGAGFGSSNVPYSSNPLFYPRDIYEVLFNPLPFSARSLSQLVAALENTVIVVVIIASLRRLRIVLHAGRQRSYVLVALAYSAAFLYAFAALGNSGLITRERTLLLPMLFVLLSIPMSDKGEMGFAWHSRHGRRRAATETFSHGAGATTPVAAWETVGPVSATWERSAWDAVTASASAPWQPAVDSSSEPPH